MLQNEHTLKRFDNELQSIRAHTMEMGGLVEMQFKLALQSLCETNAYIARQAIDQDRRINQLEVEIDALCCSAIARHQPTARDLRSIVAATKITAYMERIGDEARKIAQMAERRAQQNFLAIPRFSEIRHAAELTQNMLQEALDSFARHDQGSARKVIDCNDQVREEFDSIFRHLIGFMTENPRTISTSLDILFIAKAIERIGTHVKHIAELVIDSSIRQAENIAKPLQELSA